MRIQSFFDQDTATVTYVVSDEVTQQCAIVDPVQDFDLVSGQLYTRSADAVIDYITQSKLTLSWILETHVHADHLSAASYLQSKLGGKRGIGEHITKVLAHWLPIFNMTSTPKDGSQFDVLFKEGDEFNIGNLVVTVIHLPGHTPDSIGYHIEDALFVGDTLFMPYVGTGRTDFPGGSAADEYHSIQKIFALPENTRLYTGHDYPPEGQAPAWQSTIAEQKQHNLLVHSGISRDAFIATRTQKDQGKPAPKLLNPALQANLRGRQQ